MQSEIPVFAFVFIAYARTADTPFRRKPEPRFRDALAATGLSAESLARLPFPPLAPTSRSHPSNTPRPATATRVGEE